jgi:hypothetical protein
MCSHVRKTDKIKPMENGILAEWNIELNEVSLKMYPQF